MSRMKAVCVVLVIVVTPLWNVFAQSDVDATSQSVLNELFDKPVDKEQKAEFDSFMAVVKAKSSAKEQYKLLTGKLSEMSHRPNPTDAFFALGVTAEAIRLQAQGVSGTAGMKRAFSLLVTLQKKGALESGEVRNVFLPFDKEDVRRRKRLMQHYLADAYLEHEVWDDAARLYDILFKETPVPYEFSLFRFKLAKAYYGAGRQSEADVILDKLDAEQRETSNLGIGFYMFRFYESIDQPKKAIDLAEAYVKNGKASFQDRKQRADYAAKTREKYGYAEIDLSEYLQAPAPPPVVKKKESDENPDIRKLRIALQKKYSQLSSVSVNTKMNDVSFQTVDLSLSETEVDEKKYYAFRFTTPEEGGSLCWAFAAPKGLLNWFIIPAEGRMRGFTGFKRQRLPKDVPNVGKKNDIFYIQHLSRYEIRTRTDYIIWFRVLDKSGSNVRLSLNMLPNEHIAFPQVFPSLFSKPSEGSTNTAPQ